MCGFRGFQKDQGERELYKMGVVVQRLSEKKRTELYACWVESCVMPCPCQKKKEKKRNARKPKLWGESSVLDQIAKLSN